MIFYEEVYDKINEDYLNGEISYEMAEAANDLAYDTYITVEEAENVSSANPDPSKIDSILSKFSRRFRSINSKCTKINNTLKKMGNEIDANKTIINKIKKGNENNITPQELSIFKKLQQNIITIAKDVAKMIKEYLSVINWKNVAISGAGGALVGIIHRKNTINNLDIANQFANNGGIDNSNPFAAMSNDLKAHPIKSRATYAGYNAASFAGKDIAWQLIWRKKVRKLEKEYGIDTAISKIINTTMKFSERLQVKLDVSVTAMFDKFKKSK